MRCLVAVLIVLTACSSPSSPPAEAKKAARSLPVSDLRFNDHQLQAIARSLTRQARLRGIETSSGNNRVECLLSLEAALGGPDLALQRVNRLVAEMTATDVSQWGKLRQRAEREFRDRHDEAAPRVRDLLARWQQRKAESVAAYLSSNYRTTYIASFEWERRFHDFVAERPIDAGTWGWLVLREYALQARQQYGRADAESAYRFYLEFSGLGDGREARRIFSVPGTAMP